MYYVFDRKALLAGRWINEGPFFDDIDFDIGVYIDAKKVKAPLKYSLMVIDENSEDHGICLPSYMYDAYPLFRDDLVAALRECGIDNLQVFDAVVHDPESGKNILNYKAVNIVGLVSAANMEKSDATVHQEPALIDVEFDKLVIDPNTAKNLLIFRLAEATGTIIVHKRLRDCLVNKGFDKDLEFYEPDEVAI